MASFPSKGYSKQQFFLKIKCLHDIQNVLVIEKLLKVCMRKYILELSTGLARKYYKCDIIARIPVLY